jgi:hypothetical protein
MNTTTADFDLIDDDAEELTECSWCGRQVAESDTDGGQCPECCEAEGNLSDAADRAGSIEDEVEQLRSDLADAIARLRDARRDERIAQRRFDRRQSA